LSKGIRIRDWRYLGALLLLSASTLYFTFWAAVDILARLGWWPDGWLGFSGASLIQSLTWLDELLFSVHGITKYATLFGLVRKSRWTIWVMVAVLTLSVVQWILLTSNPVYDASVDGFAFIIVDLMALALIYLMRVRRVM